MKRAIMAFLCAFAIAALHAQVGPLPAATVLLLKTRQQVASVPAGNAPTLVNVNRDAPAAGQDSIDVLVSAPNVVISLLLPGGTEITPFNASSNGFTFSTYISDGSGASGDLRSASLTPGTHTIIDFPVPAPTGVYTVKS